MGSTKPIIPAAHTRRPQQRRALAMVAGSVLVCLANHALATSTTMPVPVRIKQPPCASPKRAATPALRVAAIGYHLAVANRADCPSRTMLTGLLLHDRAAYDERTRQSLTGLGNGFGILGVVTGSPAELAGLTTGDEIIALEGVALAQWRTDLESRRASYARIEAFTAQLVATLSHGPAHLRILRDGQEQNVVLAPQAGCAVAFALLPGRSPDAWTDGRYIAVTEGLVADVEDDALAFAMAHELAHVALGHAQEAERPLAVLGIGAGRVRKEETEADLLGLRFAYTAGYGLEGSAMLFEALAKHASGSIGFTHPSNSTRAATLAREAARLAQLLPGATAAARCPQ